MNSNVNLEFFSTLPWLELAVIVGCTVLAIIIARTVIFGLIKRTTHLTDSKHDDALADSLKKPITLIPLSIGLYILINALPLSENLDAYAELFVLSYFYITIFSSLASSLDPVKDIVAEQYEFLTPTLRNWIFRTLKFLTYLIAIVSVLELWGVDAASIIAGLGLFSVAIALGAQNFFKNLIGGLLIIGEKRFKQGDWINIEGVAEGEVEKIDFRSTLIRRFDKAPIYVPNSVLSDSEIINFSEMPFRRIRFHVGLIYQTSPETIMAIRKDIEKYIESNDNLVNSEEVRSTIRVTNFNDSSIDVLVNCFTKSTQWHDFCVAREDLILEIMRIVKSNGSDFAYPTRTIHLEKD